ncbi:MAG: MotA/TolQ/ExbB proton channel family protein [Myxococcota bacterium]
MYEFLVKGGPLIIAIGACSVVALGVFLERLWSLKRSRVIPDSFIQRIENLIGEQRVPDALLLCQENANPMANIMAAALRNASHKRSRIKEAVEDVGRYEGAMLERHVEVVGTCSAISPLLGLLGTVLGMIRVFQGVEEHGLGDPAFFASGIWEALITTAVGLAVAIPAFIFYKYLLARVDVLVIEMEDRSMRLVDLVAQE